MKTLSASQSLAGGASASRFESARAFAFPLAESGPYEYFGPGSFINIRVSRGNEMICRGGDKTCVFHDDWTSNLT